MDKRRGLDLLLGAALRTDSAVDRFELIGDVAIVHATHGRFKDALKVAAEIDCSSHRPDGWDAPPFLTYYGMYRQETEGDEEFDDSPDRDSALMTRRFLWWDVMEHIATAMANAGLFSEAWAIAQRIDDPRAKAEVCRALAIPQARAGLLDEAIRSYSVAAEQSDGDPKAEIRFFRERARALACIAEGREADALSAFEVARKTAIMIDDPDRRDDLVDDLVEDQLHNGLIKSGIAVALSHDWRDGPDQILGRVVSKLAAFGRLDDALANLAKIEADSNLEHTTNDLILATAPPDDPVRSATLSFMAPRLTARLEECKNNVWALCTLALLQSNDGDAMAAAEALQQARRLAMNESEFRNRVTKILQIAETGAEIGRRKEVSMDLRGVAKIARESGEHWHVCRWISAAAGRFNALRLFELAEEAFDIAIDLARNCSDPLDRAESLEDIAKDQFDAGFEHASAITMHTASGEARAIKDIDARDETLNSLAFTYGRLEMFDEARAIIDEIDAMDVVEHALSWLASDLAKAGAIERALATAEELERENDRDIAYGWIAEHLVEVGEYDLVLSCLDKIVDHGNRAQSLGAVISALNHRPTDHAIAEGNNGG